MDRILRDYVDTLHDAMDATAHQRPDAPAMLRRVEDYASLIELVLAAQLRLPSDVVGPPPPKPTERDI